MATPSAGQNSDSEQGPEPPETSFAAALRDLRAAAGSPSFREMGRIANYAPSTFSDATRGKRLPTRAVAEAFARACGADPGEWGERWAHAVTEAADPSGEQPPPPRRRAPVRSLLLVIATALISVTATRLAFPTGSGSTTTTAPATLAIPSDGQDPATAGCGPDATVLGETPLSLGTSGTGMIELKYSPGCHAGWARFYLNPNSTPMFAEVRVQASDGRASAFAYLAEGNTPIYTDLLKSAGGCLKASVVVHIGNREPVAVTTPCIQGS